MSRQLSKPWFGSNIPPLIWKRAGTASDVEHQAFSRGKLKGEENKKGTMSSTGKEVSLNKTQVSGIVFWDVSGIGDRCSNSYGALSAIAGSLVHTLRLCWGPTSFSLTKCQTATLPQRPNTTNKLGLMFGKSTVQHHPRTSHRTAQAVLQGKGAAPHNRNKSQSKV